MGFMSHRLKQTNLRCQSFYKSPGPPKKRRQCQCRKNVLKNHKFPYTYLLRWTISWSIFWPFQVWYGNQSNTGASRNLCEDCVRLSVIKAAIELQMSDENKLISKTNNGKYVPLNERDTQRSPNPSRVRFLEFNHQGTKLEQPKT